MDPLNTGAQLDEEEHGRNEYVYEASTAESTEDDFEDQVMQPTDGILSPINMRISSTSRILG